MLRSSKRRLFAVAVASVCFLVAITTALAGSSAVVMQLTDWTVRLGQMAPKGPALPHHEIFSLGCMCLLMAFTCLLSMVAVVKSRQRGVQPPFNQTNHPPA